MEELHPLYCRGHPAAAVSGLVDGASVLKACNAIAAMGAEADSGVFVHISQVSLGQTEIMTCSSLCKPSSKEGLTATLVWDPICVFL